MEHTKEPWGIYEPSDGYESGCIVDAANYHVADCQGGRTPEQDEANARRIVDCVNAMQGIADPAAMRAAFDAMQDALDWAIAEIEGRTRYTPNDFYAAEEQREEARSRARSALTAARIARGGA